MGLRRRPATASASFVRGASPSTEAPRPFDTSLVGVPPQYLDRFQRCASLFVDLLHQLLHQSTERRHLARSPDPALGSLLAVIDVLDRGFGRDPPHAPYRHPGEVGDLHLVVTGGEQGMDLMPFQQRKKCGPLPIRPR